MILQIRGNSGSGKTTLIKKAMKNYRWDGVYVERRKKPLYYRSGGVVLLGHYEDSACGGCDTLSNVRHVCELIDTLDYDLLIAEGLLLSEDVKWTTQLKTDHDKLFVFLATPFDECLRRIRKRREAAGNFKPLSLKHTTRRIQTIGSAHRRLSAAGYRCIRRHTSQALTIVRMKLDKFGAIPK